MSKLVFAVACPDVFFLLFVWFVWFVLVVRFDCLVVHDR